jgi:hypothetical protein
MLVDGIRIIRSPIRDARANWPDTDARVVLVAGPAEGRIIPMWASSIALPGIPAG